MRKTFISLILATFLLINSGLPALGITYQVKPGENLYRISIKTGISVDSLMKANNLADIKIIPDQVLQIPTLSNSETYIVQTGDNLFRIALRHHVSVEAIKKASILDNETIKVGQKIIIPLGTTNGAEVASAPVSPAPQPDKKEPEKPVQEEQSTTAVISGKVITEEDKRLLARLIYAEARGESEEGKTAVGAVIINRLKNPSFPKSINDIIYQKRGSVYQFSPVGNGSINMEPDTAAFKAADAALKGVDPSGGALFFYNPDKTTDQWIRTLPDKHRIGNHIFAK